MKYRLLALDLDYTLLNDEFKISKRNAVAIRKIMEKGMKVTIATGRMVRSTLPFARELALDLPLITYHGALIINAGDGEVLRHCPVPYEIAQEILRLGEQKKWYLNLYHDDMLFIKKESEESRYYQSIASMQVHPVGKLSVFLSDKQLNPTKLTIINKEGQLASVESLLKNTYPELSILQSRPYFLEITHKDATKGRALDFLATRENILPEQVVAIGDSYNDIDMLVYAGLGVAVANAKEKVKDAADIITCLNTEDGVAVFIEKHLL